MLTHTQHLPLHPLRLGLRRHRPPPQNALRRDGRHDQPNPHEHGSSKPVLLPSSSTRHGLPARLSAFPRHTTAATTTTNTASIHSPRQ
jgi:hypothetical protein